MKSPVLVCFAVKEEAAAFKKHLPRGQVQTLVTGMGRNNAERSIRAALESNRSALVLTCGFAGGLHPVIKTGTVLYENKSGGGQVSSALRKAGAVPARFHCAQRVATAAQEKRELRASTQADAVEMESQFICAICSEKSIPCVTVRVVLDDAQSDLPLDFNALMNSKQEMDFKKLAFALARSPGKIPALLRLQKESRFAAERLAEVLLKFIALT
jgi:adenosylhomocysteine nucleosidase